MGNAAGIGAKVEWNEYPSGGLWFHSPNGADGAVDFLRRHVLGEGVEGGTADLMDMLED